MEDSRRGGIAVGVQGQVQPLHLWNFSTIGLKPPEKHEVATSEIFHGVNLPGPNYQELVTPFGSHGERVEDPKRLAGAIKNGLAAVAQGKVAILAVALSG